MTSRLVSVAVLIFSFLKGDCDAQTQVQDIFGRSLDQRGITLVDWDGYMANPLLQFYIFAPTNAALPGSAQLRINGPRLYFASPSGVSTNGPSKTLSLPSVATGVPIGLSIFPDRDSVDEDYTLTIVFTAANNEKQTNTLPIHVIDQDLQRTNEFNVIQNFDRDKAGFFTNTPARLLVTQAADDWSYFFTNMNLNTVLAGRESTFIWSNNNNGGYYFANTNVYNGFLLYTYGFTNVAHTSGGQGNWFGPLQTNQSGALKINRSGTYNAEIYGNYNDLGWLYLTNDNDWLATGNLGDEANDLYSVAHHEIGHALMFDASHPGFGMVVTNGAFISAAVTDYFGGVVPVDNFNHFTNAIDPESGQGAFGHEYYGLIPRKRWLITKLDLLCAQEVGYTLRSCSALVPLTFPGNSLPPATSSVAFSNTFAASGGIVVYSWDVSAGALPPGMTLDSFTGSLTGTPVTNGVFNFTVRVRDYHEVTAGLTRSFSMNVSPPPSTQLDLSFSGQGTNTQAQLTLAGTTGQHQAIQASTNLVNWTSLATNASGTNLFQFTETNVFRFPQRFYRSVVVP